MSEPLRVLFVLLIAAGALVLALRLAGWRTKRACDFILRDLREKNAFDPATAVELPYSRAKLFHIGLRDVRPQALKILMHQDRVRVLEDGRYYLRDRSERNP